MDANAYSAGMVAGAAGVDDYYSEYLDYKNAFEEMRADRDKWVAFNERLQRDYNQLYKTARTLTHAIKNEAPGSPFADVKNIDAIYHGEKEPEDFGIVLSKE